VRNGDGSGSPVPLGAGWPRELLGSPFGSAVQFQLQGCTWTCGPWSDTFSAPEPSLTFAVTGLEYDAAQGLFSWTNGPDNGPAFPASYQCSLGEGGASNAGSPPTCTVPGPVPTTGPAHLVVTVNGRDFTYDK
jgi:hypothetical protein